jgi:6-phospho-beta-glucosidase
MKLAVVGGGSTYSPELAEGLGLRAAALGLEVLALTDVDAGRLSVVGGFVQRMLAVIAPTVRVELEADLGRAVSRADFVVTQIRVGGQQSRHADEMLGRRHGLLGQETTGVGGFAKAMRTIPVMLGIAAAIEEHAPGAVLINFTNPVSIVTEALLRHTEVKAIGLCNIPIGLRIDLANLLEVAPERVKLDSVGLNHLSFVRRVLVDGADVLPSLVDRVAGARAGKPANIPELAYPDAFLEALGMVPSDYLRYFFLQRETLAEQAASERTRAEEVLAIEEELLAHYADPKSVDKPAALSKRGGAHYSHAAIEIIEAISADSGAELVVDVQNRGAVAELGDEVVVEIPCRVGASGATPLPQRPLEPVIRGLIQHVKAYEELTVEAARTADRRSALLALAAHPLVPSVETAVQVIDELAGDLGLA